MQRTARRLASFAAVVISTFAGVLALGTSAQAAEATATVTWHPGPDYATIQLNDEAVWSAINYSSGLGWGIDDLCGQASGVINGKRQAAGYAVGLEKSDCVTYVRECVNTLAVQSHRVMLSVYADLSHGCSIY